MTEPLLSVRNLRTQFRTDDGVVRAVDGVSFDVDRGETVCIVGESGSGKTVTSESITRILQMPPAEIAGGEIRFDGMDLATASEAELERIRGGRIAHVFQNPQGALNPVYTVGWQIVEAVRLHDDVSKAAARDRAVDLLTRVGIPEASARFDDYPHEFSGGMKQRVVIAMALASSPDLLIADEPTTALDVTIQAQILRLLADIQAEFGMSVLLITHDLGVVAQVADRVVVMYAGKVMERGDVFDIFERPSHPYTRALLTCLPGRGEEMGAIGGALPDPTDPPSGCRFHPRCPHALDDCAAGEQMDTIPVDSTDRGGAGAGDGAGPPGGAGGGEGRRHEAACIFYRPGYDSSVVLEDDYGHGVPSSGAPTGTTGSGSETDSEGGDESGSGVETDGGGL